MNTAWTEAHETILLAGHDAGKSARTIAAELTEAGYPATRNTVLGKLFRKGLSKPAEKPKRKVYVADTGPAGCRWPIGDPGEPGFHFCEAPKVVLGKPYCLEHCQSAYRRADEKVEA